MWQNASCKGSSLDYDPTSRMYWKHEIDICLSQSLGSRCKCLSLSDFWLNFSFDIRKDSHQQIAFKRRSHKPPCTTTVINFWRITRYDDWWHTNRVLNREFRAVWRDLKYLVNQGATSPNWGSFWVLIILELEKASRCLSLLTYIMRKINILEWGVRVMKAEPDVICLKTEHDDVTIPPSQLLQGDLTVYHRFIDFGMLRRMTLFTNLTTL